MQKLLRKSRLFAAAWITLGLMIGAGSVKAYDRDDEKCEKKMHKAEENLEKAVRKHGEHSRQAEERRHQLEEVRERCHHGDHDHDHDHDHDKH